MANISSGHNPENISTVLNLPSIQRHTLGWDCDRKSETGSPVTFWLTRVHGYVVPQAPPLEQWLTSDGERTESQPRDIFMWWRPATVRCLREVKFRA